MGRLFLHKTKSYNQGRPFNTRLLCRKYQASPKKFDDENRISRVKTSVYKPAQYIELSFEFHLKIAYKIV